MLPLVSLDRSLNSFVCCITVGDRLELRARLARCSAPMDKIAVPVSVEGQLVIGEEPPAFGIGWHRTES